MIRKVEDITVDIIHFMLKANMNRKEVSYFLPSDMAEIKELIEDGAICYIHETDNILDGAMILDFVDDNMTIEVNGPFGSLEVRDELTNYILEVAGDYKPLLFTSNQNELANSFVKLSEELSMEILCKSKDYSSNITTDLNKDELINLHDIIFENTYMNGNRLVTSDNKTVAYVLDNKVVGYISYNSEDCYLDYLGVSEKYRNNGIATELLNYCINDLKGNVLKLTVGSNNLNAISLYKKYGFRNTHNMILVSLKG